MNKKHFNEIFELLNLKRQSNTRMFFDYHYTLFLYDTYLYSILYPVRSITHLYINYYDEIEISINNKIIRPILNELELYDV